MKSNGNELKCDSDQGLVHLRTHCSRKFKKIGQLRIFNTMKQTQLSHYKKKLKNIDLISWRHELIIFLACRVISQGQQNYEKEVDATIDYQIYPKVQHILVHFNTRNINVYNRYIHDRHPRFSSLVRLSHHFHRIPHLQQIHDSFHESDNEVEYDQSNKLVPQLVAQVPNMQNTVHMFKLA